MKTYYDLTKQKYKDANKRFKKTYVGRQICNEMTVCYVSMLLFTFLCGWDMSASEADTLFGVIYDAVFIAIFALATILFKIEKERMLKEYISIKE